MRKVGRVYAERHKLINDILSRDFKDHLVVVRSIAGLHITALARGSAEEIEACVARAAERGVSVQQLARFSIELPKRPGLMFGYGAIQTGQVKEGLKRLLACFD